MKHITAFAYLLLLLVSVHATILGVSLDGTQPYYYIQYAINASSHGDTVLVYPGRYYETISLNGKNITLASLELTTGNADYIQSTTIDGCRQNSVIIVNSGENNVKIQGFTITNGKGYINTNGTRFGGGLLIYHTAVNHQIRIVNCEVKDNISDLGGGIYIERVNVHLSGVTIKENHASSGGGIYYYGGSLNTNNVIFDPVNRCSVYSNFAAAGMDINTYWVNQTHVVLDTFTVINPSNFYAYGNPIGSSANYPFSFDILHSVHEEINQDLYVAPWGDDNNSGLSPAEPLKTIFLATYKIASDSLNPKTIHLTDGHYSPDLNGQVFPISLKNHSRLLGSSVENTLIDSGANVFCHLPTYGVGQKLSSFSVKNCDIVLSCGRTEDVFVENIQIYDQIFPGRPVVTFLGAYSENLTVSKCSVINSLGEDLNVVYAIPFKEKITIDGLYIENCIGNTRSSLLFINGNGNVIVNHVRALNNSSASSADFTYNSLMQITSSQTAQRMRVEITNSVFTNNFQGRYQQMASVRALNDTIFIGNSTFADNSGGSHVLVLSGTSILTNNIFWNPAVPTEVWIPNYSGFNSHSTFRYNNIRNGISGVVNSSAQNPMIWEDNNHSFDPLFAMTGNHPYMLSSESPLIDLGMDGEGAPDYTEYDAGGNERIWDGDGDGIARIDIGAYEYQPFFAPINLEAGVYGDEVFLLWEHPGNSRGSAAKPAMDENIKKSAARSSTVIPDPDRESRRSYQNPQQWKNGNRAHIGYRIYRNGMPYTDILDPEIMYFEDRITQSDTLTYYVKALYGDVESPSSNEVTVYVEVVSNSDESMPGIDFLQVSPNPFREMAVIKIGIKEPGRSRLDVYNLKGQKVKTIMNETLAKGEHYFCWNGDDDSGRNVSSGVYFLSYGNNNRILLNRKILLLK